MFPRFWTVNIEGPEMSVAASTQEAAEKIAARRVARARAGGGPARIGDDRARVEPHPPARPRPLGPRAIAASRPAAGAVALQRPRRATPCRAISRR